MATTLVEVEVCPLCGERTSAYDTALPCGCAVHRACQKRATWDKLGHHRCPSKRLILGGPDASR